MEEYTLPHLIYIAIYNAIIMAIGIFIVGKENFNHLKLYQKIAGLLAIGFVLVILFFALGFSPPEKIF